jgi:uncharacterized protein YcnI
MVAGDWVSTLDFLIITQARATLAMTGAAMAHVTLETAEAPAGSYYKAVMRVGHGCEGSPMREMRVKVPDGMVSVKPMPKPGWKVSTVIGKLEAPYESHGKTITEGVTEIRWTGGKLLDEHYDEFVFRGQLPDRTGETLYVPIVQICEKGESRWIEIPAAGQKSDDLKEPAPAIRLTPKAK